MRVRIPPRLSRRARRGASVWLAATLLLSAAPCEPVAAAPAERAQTPACYVNLERAARRPAVLRLAPPPGASIRQAYVRPLRALDDQHVRLLDSAGTGADVFVHAELALQQPLEVLVAADVAGGALMHPDSAVVSCRGSAPAKARLALAAGPVEGQRGEYEAARSGDAGAALVVRGAVAWAVLDGVLLRFQAESPDPGPHLDIVLRSASLLKSWRAEDERQPSVAIELGSEDRRRGLLLTLPRPWRRTGARSGTGGGVAWEMPSPTGKAGSWSVSLLLVEPSAMDAQALRRQASLLDAALLKVAPEVAGPFEVSLPGEPSGWAYAGHVVGVDRSQDAYVAQALFTRGKGEDGATWSVALRAPLDDDPALAWRAFRALLRSVAELPAPRAAPRKAK